MEMSANKGSLNRWMLSMHVHLSKVAAYGEACLGYDHMTIHYPNVMHGANEAANAFAKEGNVV